MGTSERDRAVNFIVCHSPYGSRARGGPYAACPCRLTEASYLYWSRFSGVAYTFLSVCSLLLSSRACGGPHVACPCRMIAASHTSWSHLSGVTSTVCQCVCLCFLR